MSRKIARGYLKKGRAALRRNQERGRARYARFQRRGNKSRVIWGKREGA